jgi:hypothetical protein
VLRIAVRTTWDYGRYANSAGLRPRKGATPSARNPAGYTALHLAAWHGPSVDIVQGLLKLGASRGLKTADDKKERALDIARRRGHAHLYDMLTPQGLPDVSDADLAKVEAHFHTVVVEEARGIFTPSMLLPDLGLLRDHPRIWMPVPGMYGVSSSSFLSAVDDCILITRALLQGFNFRWEDGHLVTESSCRVCGGSGRTNHITTDGAKLVDEGWG